MTFFRAMLPCFLLLTLGCARAPLRLNPPGATPRIVSLAPSVTETLFALGAGPQVVGVSQYCDFPPQARSLPRVGTFITPNLEAIVALRPTLVIGLATAANLPEVRALRSMGVVTLMAGDGEASSIDAIESSILRIGAAIHRDAAAHRLVNNLQHQLDAIAARTKTRPRKSVLMLVGHQPLVAVGPGAYLDQLISLAGGSNIADRADQAWPRLSLEYIIASRPEVILDGQMGSDAASPSSFWSKYPAIPAVRDHRIYGYPASPTLHPGPRLAQTLELLARRIHPQLFDAPGDASTVAAR